MGVLNDWQGYAASVGLPDFNFENEGLHGLGGACLTVNNVTRCPTSFPIPPSLGATWNVSLLRDVGAVVGKELRAFNNWHGVRNPGPRPVGLGVWLLNLNLGARVGCECWPRECTIDGFLRTRPQRAAAVGHNTAHPFLPRRRP